ncbi:MAG: hypothetical protein Q8861_16400, partial [Bacteroidota bacterium]|nr:hypothetical protein [Bacteroidota bacterium]
ANKWTEMLRIIHETECIWRHKTGMTNKRVTMASIKAKKNIIIREITTTETMTIGEKIKRLEKDTLLPTIKIRYYGISLVS